MPSNAKCKALSQEPYVHSSQTAFRGCRMLRSVGGLVAHRGGDVFRDPLTERVEKVCQEHVVCGC